MWLVGNGDLLLIGSEDPLGERLDNIEAAWRRPGVAADLASVSALEPFAYWSLYAGGPSDLARYAAGATLQTDDRMSLEFSGPRAVNSTEGTRNAAVLRQLLADAQPPPAIHRARASAGPAQWRHRGALMLAASAYDQAYDDFARALTLDPDGAGALEGLVRAAVNSRRETEIVRQLESVTEAHPDIAAVWVLLSKAYAAAGRADRAVASAVRARAIAPDDPNALEHLASLHSDAGDVAALEPLVVELLRRFPERAASLYHAAVLHFLNGRLPQALTMVQRSIEVDPDQAAAYNLAGAISASLGRRQEARTAFEHSLRLDPRESTDLHQPCGARAVGGKPFERIELLCAGPVIGSVVGRRARRPGADAQG